MTRSAAGPRPDPPIKPLPRPGSRHAGGLGSKLLRRSEVVRLGKRGSYRLGELGVRGIEGPAPLRPFRPSFTRPSHRGTVSGWILAGLGLAVLTAAGSAAGLWFAPFAAGVLAGLAARWGGWRLRVTAPAVVVLAALGWGLALWAAALLGLPVGSTARAIAALAGLPPLAVVGVAVALAFAAVQGLAGLWIGRALAPRPARH